MELSEDHDRLETDLGALTMGDTAGVRLWAGSFPSLGLSVPPGSTVLAWMGEGHGAPSPVAAGWLSLRLRLPSRLVAPCAPSSLSAASAAFFATSSFKPQRPPGPAGGALVPGSQGPSAVSSQLSKVWSACAASYLYFLFLGQNLGHRDQQKPVFSGVHLAVGTVH